MQRSRPNDRTACLTTLCVNVLNGGLARALCFALVRSTLGKIEEMIFLSLLLIFLIAYIQPPVQETSAGGF